MGGKFPHCQKAVRGAPEDCHTTAVQSLSVFAQWLLKPLAGSKLYPSERKNFEMAIFRQTVDARISQTHMGGFVIRREESWS